MSQQVNAPRGSGSTSLTVELDDEVVQELYQVAVARGMTIDEVVREALRTEFFLVSLDTDGYHILVADKSDQTKILARLVKPISPIRP
jgi:nucleoside-triphosphatase THEP1